MIERVGRFLALRFRKRRRYRAKNGLCAVSENHIVGNQIGDIGMGGLSFYYIDNGSRPKKDEYGITLVSGNKQRKVHLSCKTVCDLEAGQMVSQNRCIKRRCVSFQRLNRQQKQKLKNIIKDETFGLY
jgi:hypothetical protein